MSYVRGTDISKLLDRIVELEAWIKVANQFAWAHETDCPRRAGDHPCSCGLDQFLGRPKPFIESYKQQLGELETEIRELKAWAGKNEGLMQFQDRVIEAVSKKVTELESENAELKKAIEFQKHIFQLASEHRDELDSEIAELRKRAEDAEAGLQRQKQYFEGCECSWQNRSQEFVATQEKERKLEAENADLKDYLLKYRNNEAALLSANEALNVQLRDMLGQVVREAELEI